MQNNSVSDIKPIIPPESIEFWPPEPGWYVLALLVLLGIFLLMRYYLELKKKNLYRKKALQELQLIAALDNSQTKLQDLNRLLKVTALNGFPRDIVAELTGQNWLRFLSLTSKHLDFTKAPANILAEVSYLKSSKTEISSAEFNTLVEISSKWIKTHNTKLLKNKK